MRVLSKEEREAWEKWNHEAKSAQYGTEEYSRFQAEKEEKLKEVKAVLRAHGIYMSVSGCGCCGSPSVTFVDGEHVLLWDVDNADFSTDQ